MRKSPNTPKLIPHPKKLRGAATDDLHHLAFDNSVQANLVSRARTGKILIANRAACRLLGYSKKELLTKNRADIVDINEPSFKRMFKNRKTTGHSTAWVTMIKKDGGRIPCEITSATFKGRDGYENGIITITNMSQRILKQKNIDAVKEKIVAANIALAISKQKIIDARNAKKVADNIALAISKQKTFDARNAKKVARNIVISISKQIEIDAIREKKVTANIALAISKQKNIDANNAKTVAANIVLAISKQIGIDAGNAKIVADNIALAILKQKEIDTRNAKTVADNIALAILKQKDIDTRNAKKVAADIVLAISKQIAIDTIKEKVVTANIALAISRQKNIDTNNAKKVAADIVLAISKQITIDEGNAKIVADDIALAILKQKKIDTKKEKIVAANILQAQKRSAGEKLHFEIAIRKKLHKEFKENFKLTFNASSDVLYDSNLLTDEVLINDAYEKDFGYKITKHMSPAVDWASHIHANDKAAVYKDYTRMLASEETEWEAKYRFLKADGTVANVISRGIVLRDDTGKAYRMIGYMKDLSKQKVLEEKLEMEIKLKEIQIEEAAVEAKETERSDIGKELHDNINQLLGASKMYLEMAKQGGEQSGFFLNRSSEYTLKAIEEIRRLTKGLCTDIIRNLGLGEAISSMIHDTMEVNPMKISYAESGYMETSVNDKFKLNLFRIAQEQLNNIIKHAQATEVVIRLSQNKKAIVLSLSDNGIGFDTCKHQKGIGIANIKSRAISYKGTADFVSKTGHGCLLKVTFPVTDKLLRQAIAS